MSTAPSALLEALRGLLGERVSCDAADLRHWGRDWTRHAEPAPLAVVWPRDTAEVAAVLRLCSDHGQAVVPSGGRTGLAGGAVAAHGEVVLSLDRLRDLGEVDIIGGTVEAGAGVPNQVLQDHCRPAGLWWPVDLAAKGSATVGGNLATNAGGVRVLRYGMARQWLLGLEAVTMAGEVLRLGGALHKDNSGYALQQLLVGSEGTLAVLTRATLKLAPLPGAVATALLACPSLDDALALLPALRRLGLPLQAFEVLDRPCLAAVTRHAGLPWPLAAQTPWYALVEAETADPAPLTASLHGEQQAGRIVDGTVASDPHASARLWAYRERIAEALQPHAPYKLDLAVPVAALAGLADAVPPLLQAALPGWQVVLFGHAGDGNLHVNALPPEGLDADGRAEACRRADDALSGLVARLGGSWSAEHGVGTLKRETVARLRDPAELAAWRGLKAVWDPRGLLNPGKVVS